MGTSTCFYTRLSQRQGDAGLVAFYRKLVLWASALIIGGALVLAGTPVGKWLWAGEGALLIGLAACYAAATWWLDTTRKMVDAWHLTVGGEILHAASRLVAVVALVAAIWIWGLRLEGYLIYQIAAALLSMGVLTHFLGGHDATAESKVTPKPVRGYIREFWDYSHPLLIYGIVGMLVGLADRWILQTRASAIEQGFFGLAYQVGAVCFLFTSAMTQLLSREFAVAWDRKDMERMRAMFRRIIPMLYTIAAYFSVFISWHAKDVVLLFGGHGWEHGALSMTIMALYPMHQTYGQLSGSVYHATGQTKLYRNIGIVSMTTGVPVMLWLVLPSESGGLGLGAVGLALKMLVLQSIFVNVQLWFNVRLLSLSFWRFLFHQLSVPIILSACVLSSDFILSFVELPRNSQFLLAGAGYTLFVAMVILLMPQLVGLQRGEIDAMLRKLLSKKSHENH